MSSRVISTSQDLVLNSVSGNVKIGSSNVLKASDIGSSIQAYDALLNDISGLTLSSGQFLKYDGSNIVGSADNNTTYTADGSTLQLSGTEFSVLSIGTSQIANNAITSAKLSAQSLKDVAGLDVASNSGKVIKSDGTNLVLATDNGTSYTAGDGLGLSGTEFSVDNSVVRTSGDQSLGGLKTFTSNIEVDGNAVVQGYLNQNISNNGYYQSKMYEASTTNNTTATLASIAIGSNEMCSVEVYVNCINADSSSIGSFKLIGAVVNAGGTLTGSSLQQEIVYRSNGNINAVLDVNSTNVRVRITGETSVNYRWNAFVKQVACSQYA